MCADETSTGAVAKDRAVTLFILVWAVIFGTLARILPAWLAGAPVNDGGLFYQMTEDILQAGYTLPIYTSFNQAQIPFAYPPLAFYLAAFLSRWMPLWQVFRWIPPVLSVATIPAVYLLGRAVLKSDLKAAFSALAYAMLPAAFDLLIVGGGSPVERAHSLPA